MILLGLNIFWKFADENFVVCFLVVKSLKLVVLGLSVQNHKAIRVSS